MPPRATPTRLRALVSKLQIMMKAQTKDNANGAMEKKKKQLADSIEAELRKNKIKDPDKRLCQQILSFVTESPEIPEARFFPVGLVPNDVQWRFDQETPTWGKKPVYIWIVGIVSSCHLLRNRGDPMEDNVSVMPFVTFVESAEELLKRYGQPAMQPLSSNGAITVERSMANGSDPSKAGPFLNVFDAREGYVDTIKSDTAKRITDEDVVDGDAVLIEALLSRTPLAVESSATSQERPPYSVTFKLVDIILLADGKNKSKKGVAVSKEGEAKSEKVDGGTESKKSIASTS